MISVEWGRSSGSWAARAARVAVARAAVLVAAGRTYGSRRLISS